MIEEDEDYKKLTFVDFMRKTLDLIKIEITVT